MSEPLQKKCFLASGVLHALLLGVALLASGFFSGRKTVSLPVITMLPPNAVLTDDKTTGGGSPTVATPPAVAQVTPAAPAAQPTREPEPPKPAPATPEKSFPLKPTTPKKSADTAKAPTPEKKYDLKSPAKGTATPKKTAPRRPATTDDSSAAADAAARADAKARRDGIAAIASRIGKEFSSHTSIDIPGPGGRAFMNYGQLVQSRYQVYYNQLLTTAKDIARGDTEVDVAVTITRDGRVVKGAVLKPSGNRDLDRLIRRVLDDIKEFPPFPEGATDERRTFNLTFELKAKLAG
ncbi:MAG: TonB family protein [Verrucomicrobia bacterium]|nr:TonB family protein [Verrucomicrobiota bacterium]